MFLAAICGMRVKTSRRDATGSIPRRRQASMTAKTMAPSSLASVSPMESQNPETSASPLAVDQFMFAPTAAEVM